MSVSDARREGAALPPVPARRRPLAPFDALVLLTTLVWGSNYTIVKTALRQIPEFGFNALRLVIASTLFMAVLAVYPGRDASARGETRRANRRLFPTARPFSRREWVVLLGLAAAGHFLYQLCFLGSVARTSVANSSFIIGTSPVAVSLLSAAVGQERVSRLHWVGAAVSLSGIYLLVGVGASVSRASAIGDLLMIAGVCCWAVYAVGSGPLLARHSPLAITGYTMAMGTLMYLPFGLPDLVRLDWSAVTAGAWAGLVFSAVFALFAAYIIWHTSIQRVGNVRTAMYSNLIPVSALATAILVLGDRPSPRQAAGAGAVLVGVGLTRLRRRRLPELPAEE